jgi:hypothetical protein
MKANAIFSMKNLLVISLVFFVVSCSKSSNDSENNTPTTAYIKVKVEGKEYKFEGDVGASEKGCAIRPDGGNTSWRLVGYDGTQFMNIWVNNMPVEKITATSYTYNDSSIDWELNGYNTGDPYMANCSITLAISSISSGKHTGTFSGTVVIKQAGASRTVPASGDFANVKIFR